MLYRHWTQWQSKRRSHLLVVPVAGGPAKDLTPGMRDVPPFSLEGLDDYDIAPDGTEVCYSMNADPVPATSTNTDLYAVPIAGGDARKRLLRRRVLDRDPFGAGRVNPITADEEPLPHRLDTTA